MAEKFKIVDNRHSARELNLNQIVTPATLANRLRRLKGLGAVEVRKTAFDNLIELPSWMRSNNPQNK